MELSRENFLHSVGERLARRRRNFFLEVDTWKSGDMLWQMHISSIVICINIGHKYMYTCMLFKCLFCLACGGSGSHYQPHYTWLVVYITTATPTIQFDDLSSHLCFSLTFTNCYPVQDTCFWKCPKLCAQSTKYSSLSDRFLNNRC